MTSFSIQTFGCRSNQAEAFLWADVFQKHGLKYEKDFSRSDLVVVNSCTLTSRADSDTRSFIRRVSRVNPKARLIVTGCYAERAPEELRNMPQVSCLLSNKEKKNLDAKVLSFADPGKEKQISPFRSRASVKIQDGCNFRCTFCIIPSVRGRSVSSERREILDRIKEFISQGFNEIVLTGIHLCSYGLDLKPKSSILELLQAIESLKGLRKLRLSSLDPRFLSPSLIEHITTSEKVCPHFHLSLQSGSEDILHRMGRKVRIEDYKKILVCLREKSPRASLGADIIVGFPGETEEDFSQTYRFLEQSPLTYFHVFSYSPRPRTAAAPWPQVNGNVKKRRARLLRDLSRRKNTNFRRLFAGKECEAIVIKNRKAGAEVLTSNYFKVFVPSCPHDEGKEVRVKITKVDTGKTTGQIVNLPSS
ncbi:MAG: tRNA (N(6)-L-threonylcarbamoyladenosine(37)-C(2))-methylthiotransferase MtaB [Candidatus Aminicenantes bacterium]|nr:tRNA (N(6)-L-threonylcarbamoyladenosine(37)-C(2))-methylthiotransferase MtaB [Candidatus Aminicenantes bacterium]